VKEKQKIIVVLGPTASGKSDLAVKLAKKWNGEIISADSRQVYRGMDIGTGKITKKEMAGIKHYLLDVANPKQTFNAEKFKKLTEKAVKEITKKNKIPIICGGTGFYIDVLLGNLKTSPVKPNPKLRKELEKQSLEDLSEILKKLDEKRFTNIDLKNKRRLIRAIEIATANPKKTKPIESNFDPLYVGIKTDRELLKKKIGIRLKKRLKSGMVKEAKKILKSGVSHKKLQNFGLEYKHLSLFLKGQETRQEFEQKLILDIYHYAKRQETWFKKNKKTNWFKNTEIEKINKVVKKYLD